MLDPNVAMLDPNVATLAAPLSGKSRRCAESRDVVPERRDVAPVYCLEASHNIFFSLPSHTPAHTPTGTPCYNLRPPTTSPPLPPPVVPHLRWSSVPVSHIHHHAVVPSPLPLLAPCEFGFSVALSSLVPIFRSS